MYTTIGGNKIVIYFFIFHQIPIVTIQKSNKTLQGLRNVVSEVSFHKDAELAAIQDGWLEFIQTHVDNFESSDTLKVTTFDKML